MRPPRIGHRSGTAIQVAAGLLVTALLLLVAEGVARLVVGAPPARSGPAGAGGGEDYVASTLSGLDIAPELNPTPLVTDPFVLWWNKPLARKTQPVNPRPFGRDDTWTIENDARGFRGPARDDAAGGDVYRVLCVGDSVTFGFNVDQPHPYPRRLEEILRARHPGARIDVLNAGVPGWSWVQGLRFLEAYGLPLDPDLVVAGHGTNDQFWKALVTDRERLPGGGQPAPEMRRPSLLQRTSVYRLLQRLGRGAAAAPAPSPGCRQEIARSGSCRRVPLPDIATTVREMHRMVQAHGAELVVLNVDFMETAAAGPARQAAEAAGIPYVDFVQRFHASRRTAENERAVAHGLAPAGPLGPPAPDRPRRVVFRVVRPATLDGPLSVRGGAYFRDDFPFEAALRDDGTGGDEVAGDRVFSGTVEAPTRIGVLEYTFWAGDACEFAPLPPLPSSSGTRLLRFDRDTLAPLVEFGDAFLMAERTHPNARGHEVIATDLADLIETLPSFVTWRDRHHN